MEPSEFEGVVGRTLEESTPWWPPLPTAPEGAPNVVLVLLDDVGYAQFGCYGSDIATPTFDRLAAGGLRYGNFHTTALCSPTRACLLTGRNHHTQRHGAHRRVRRRLPRLRRDDPEGERLPLRDPRAQRLRHVRRRQVAPHAGAGDGDGRAPRALAARARASSGSTGSSAARPTSSTPTSCTTTTRSTRRRRPEEGYHLTEDMADKRDAVHQGPARRRRRRSRSSSTSRRAPATRRTRRRREYIDAYRGRFDHGLGRMARRGVRPPGRVRPAAGGDRAERAAVVGPGVGLAVRRRAPPLRADDGGVRRLPRAHRRAGRPRASTSSTSLGELDNTIVLVMSDNGASGRGRAARLVQRDATSSTSSPRASRRTCAASTTSARRAPTTTTRGAGRGPATRRSSAGSARPTRAASTDPLIVHWPRACHRRTGETRHQYVHAIDVMPTLLDADRHRAARRDRRRRAGADRRRVASRRHVRRRRARVGRHVTQYYEMMGCRALYHDGWKAVGVPPADDVDYGDGSTPPRPFDEDEWELYHVAEDFAETHDLAAKEPEQARGADRRSGGQEAERYQVLPLNNQPGAPRRPPPPARPLRVPRRHRRAPGHGGAEPAQPRRGRSTAELDVRRRWRAEGVIAATAVPPAATPST